MPARTTSVGLAKLAKEQSLRDVSRGDRGGAAGADVRHDKKFINKTSIVRVKFYTIIFISIILYACRQKERVGADMFPQLNTSDTFYFESQKPPPWFLTQKKYDDWWDSYHKRLNLTRLDQGFDSMEVRITYGGSMERIVSLMYTENGWMAELSHIVTIPNQGRDSTQGQEIDAREIEYVQPKSGWKNFLRQLIRYNITSMPIADNLPGYETGLGGFDYGLEVEIATKKYYKRYFYGISDTNPTLEVVKTSCKMLKYIDDEFRLLKMWNYTNEPLAKGEQFYWEKRSEEVRKKWEEDRKRDRGKVKLQDVTIDTIKP